MTQIETGRARPDEVAACLALLPQAAAFRPVLLTARLHGEVIGAAGLLWQSWSDPAGFPLMLHVAETHRRQGVGRALVEVAVKLADGEIEGLWTMDPIEEDSGEAAFLTASGFRLMRRQLEFEVSVDAFAAMMQPTLDRLRSTGRMPSDATVEQMTPAMVPDVAAIVGPSFGKSPASMLALWRSDPDTLDVDRSSVLLVAGKVAGTVLIQRRGDIPVIEAIAVTEEHRGGGGSALLLAHSIGRDGVKSVHTARFRCEEDARVPMALAQVAHGVLVASRGWMFYPLNK